MVYWTLDYFRILYNEYTASGVSVRDFCKEQGIKENRFYYWINKVKLNVTASSKAPKGFIPITSRDANKLTGIALLNPLLKAMHHLLYLSILWLISTPLVGNGNSLSD